MSQRAMDKRAMDIIIECFNKQYGFAPSRNKIHFLEGADNGQRWLTLGFHVGGVGYYINLELYAFGEARVERSSVYDM